MDHAPSLEVLDDSSVGIALPSIHDDLAATPVPSAPQLSKSMARASETGNV
ncbi:hypothetical protein OG612_30325 [Streptomyces sp. NBC_01527]|uniref:hypothetical protein n=1 Tax=unclassified Streptomyces TaxID=2593676 RepID=UPI002E119434|nr:hypothetical protein OG763_13040 [Streptomyces sp. NBC_01230]